jgi:hypothetical protein
MLEAATEDAAIDSGRGERECRREGEEVLTGENESLLLLVVGCTGLASSSSLLPLPQLDFGV